MATQDRQRGDDAPAVADATQDSTETTREPCPADDCDSGRAHYAMLPKPGGSYEVRLFTCVECGHEWRDSRRRTAIYRSISVATAPPR